MFHVTVLLCLGFDAKHTSKQRNLTPIGTDCTGNLHTGIKYLTNWMSHKGMRSLKRLTM